MGVRYNAEKKKIGNYYSTPIYSFRCKCHLCDGWFEIQTDPKNTRYVVVSGARQKNEDWNPEENGGFAVHGMEASLHSLLTPSLSTDTEGTAVPTDPLAALEKTTDAQNHLTKVEAPRLESLQALSEHYNADPYVLSSKVRKRFRDVKKVEQQKQKADDDIKNRYGLPDSLSLLDEDEGTNKEAKEEWKRGQRELSAAKETHKRRRLTVGVMPIPSSSSSILSTTMTRSSNSADSLRARILENTARRTKSIGRSVTGANG
ncbi:hypothetical protein C0992_006469 [Termitomyces sp. T32_za158]|nr:hypothetical protein C0992_006469 [Termitomyces sp. T32_za158]